MSKPPPFVWTEAAQEAFLRIKALFTETPVLKYPNENDMFILDTDASNNSIGAVLSQVQDGREVPLAFASNSLSKTQRNYCTTKRELLAVVVYTKKFRHYLYGGNFILRTDHSSLRWLLNFKEADGMMGRWMSSLSELWNCEHPNRAQEWGEAYQHGLFVPETNPALCPCRLRRLWYT